MQKCTQIILKSGEEMEQGEDRLPWEAEIAPLDSGGATVAQLRHHTWNQVELAAYRLTAMLFIYQYLKASR